jgi:hypothetical protein
VRTATVPRDVSAGACRAEHGFAAIQFGNEVGALARTLFPGGRQIEHFDDPGAAVRDTAEARAREPQRVDPRELDALGLSHGHYAHFGGLNGFLTANAGRLKPGLPFYLCWRALIPLAMSVNSSNEQSRVSI